MTDHGESLDTALMSDMFAIDTADQRRKLSTSETMPGPWIEVGGRHMLNLGSNNYLGLAGHSDVRTAAADAAQTWGAGSSGSRLTTGNLPCFTDLEHSLAQLKKCEDAVIFGSGYVTNVGVIQALVGSNDLVLSDALNHASLIDGCRLSRATVRVYRHADVEHLLTLLQDRSSFRRALILTDGVFSMDGDIAPLPALCDVAEAHNAWIMVDDAHGTGVLGDTGGGCAEYFGVAARIAVHMGTLSKALGSAGGYVAGSRVLTEYLRNKARSFMFATAPVPAAAAAASAALRIVKLDPERRERCLSNAAFLRERLTAAGCEVLPGITPIVPVIIGDTSAARSVAFALQLTGVWAPAIRPPTVPEGSARLRCCVMADHTEAELQTAADAIANAIHTCAQQTEFAFQ